MEELYELVKDSIPPDWEEKMEEQRKATQKKSNEHKHYSFKVEWFLCHYTLWFEMAKTHLLGYHAQYSRAQYCVNTEQPMEFAVIYKSVSSISDNY